MAQTMRPTGPPGTSTRRISAMPPPLFPRHCESLVTTSKAPSSQGGSNMSPTRMSAEGLRSRATATRRCRVVDTCAARSSQSRQFGGEATATGHVEQSLTIGDVELEVEGFVLPATDGFAQRCRNQPAYGRIPVDERPRCRLLLLRHRTAPLKNLSAPKAAKPLATGTAREIARSAPRRHGGGGHEGPRKPVRRATTSRSSLGGHPLELRNAICPSSSMDPTRGGGHRRP
jgi:hypothetical protein